MTANGNFKRKVRARAARTGESYTTALRHFAPTPPGDTMPATKSIRIAVVQSTVPGDPRDAAELRSTGRDIRRLMREAHRAGARLVHFPEGATCSPDKHVMSIHGPDEVGPSDWDRFAGDVLRQELQQTATLARELSLWTVVGAVHRLTPPHRPHNSLYVISDRGEVVTRYDERMLSNTKLSFMYTPGSTPVTFEVDNAPSGVISPQARWIARCPGGGNPALAVADLDDSVENHARPWRRTARDGIYDPHIVRDDPRSEARNAF
jgi:predicted amidohydrolase